jgi:choline dehydrogenase
MLAAARTGQRIAATAPFRDLVLEDLWPAGPPRTDEEMLDFIRSTGTTVYHPCGTCRMGSDDGAVVDPQLRVRGVDGLRIADASVFPLVPSSNIQPAVMMVAERAAAMVTAEARAATR